MIVVIIHAPFYQLQPADLDWLDEWFSKQEVDGATITVRYPDGAAGQNFAGARYALGRGYEVRSYLANGFKHGATGAVHARDHAIVKGADAVLSFLGRSPISDTRARELAASGDLEFHDLTNLHRERTA